jgi:hypothetical protein
MTTSDFLLLMIAPAGAAAIGGVIAGMSFLERRERSLIAERAANPDMQAHAWIKTRLKRQASNKEVATFRTEGSVPESKVHLGTS